MFRAGILSLNEAGKEGREREEAGRKREMEGRREEEGKELGFDFVGDFVCFCSILSNLI